MATIVVYKPDEIPQVIKLPKRQRMSETADSLPRKNAIESRIGKGPFTFVRYVTFPTLGYCQGTGAHIRKGVRVENTETGEQYIVGLGVGERYLDGLILPPITHENTAEDVPPPPPGRLGADSPKRPRGRPRKVRIDPAELEVEPGLPAHFRVSVSSR